MYADFSNINSVIECIFVSAFQRHQARLSILSISTLLIHRSWLEAIRSHRDPFIIIALFKLATANATQCQKFVLHRWSVDIYVHHGAETEPNSYIRTKFMHLCSKNEFKMQSKYLQYYFRISLCYEYIKFSYISMKTIKWKLFSESFSLFNVVQFKNE